MKIKFCNIRLDEETHRKAKLKAYENGQTLQDWLTDLIKNNIEVKNDEIQIKN